MIDVEKEREAMEYALQSCELRRASCIRMHKSPPGTLDYEDREAYIALAEKRIETLKVMLARAESSPRGAEAESGAAGMVSLAIDDVRKLLGIADMPEWPDWLRLYGVECIYIDHPAALRRVAEAVQAALSNNQAEVGE